jgi:hypothetical protein
MDAASGLYQVQGVVGYFFCLPAEMLKYFTFTNLKQIKKFEHTSRYKKNFLSSSEKCLE